MKGGGGSWLSLVPRPSLSRARGRPGNEVITSCQMASISGFGVPMLFARYFMK